MHPLKATVTAQDVEGCLYYMHFHGDGGRDDNEQQVRQDGIGGQGDFLRPKLSGAGMGGGGGRRWSANNIFRSSRESVKDFNIKLIRRDLATGEQWNVAQISSTANFSGATHTTRATEEVMGKALPPLPPITISLPGDGYKKFMAPVGADAGVSVNREPLSRDTTHYPPHLMQDVPPLPPPPPIPLSLQQGGYIAADEEEAYFRRKREYNELVAARDKANQQMLEARAEWERETAAAELEKGLVREVVHDTSGGEKWWKRGMAKTRKHWKSSSSSLGLKEEYFADRGGGAEENERKEKGSWRGYTFDALWGPLGNAGKGEKQGTCRFKDEAGGKIMRCKYYPYDGGDGDSSFLVSAVEFKLPPGMTLHRTRPSSSGGSQGEGLGSEEPAGAKSKMGTLVVHNVGMEMLDLVVAANVGMFWRKWEGWVGERGALGQ